jgi:hypothetical protein
MAEGTSVRIEPYCENGQIPRLPVCDCWPHFLDRALLPKSANFVRLCSADLIAADMAELADALDSGSSARKGVEVRLLLSALVFPRVFRAFLGFAPPEPTPCQKSSVANQWHR